MKKYLLLIVVGLALTLSACGNKYGSFEEESIAITGYKSLIEDELFYIHHKSGKPDFPIYYQQLLNDHPELEVFDVEADLNEEMHNSVSGYFVFTKLKTEKQEEKK